MPTRPQSCSNQRRNNPKCKHYNLSLIPPSPASRFFKGQARNLWKQLTSGSTWQEDMHRDGSHHTHALGLCLTQLQRKSVSQRGLEKITAMTTRMLQMCLQVQFCSMLEVRNITRGKLQFRLGTDSPWKTSEHAVANATVAMLSSQLSIWKLGWIFLLRSRDKMPQHCTRRKLSKELLA